MPPSTTASRPFGWPDRVIAFGLAGLSLASVLALASPLYWFFDLFTHFEVHYLVAAVLALALAAWRRRGRLAIVAAGLVLGHAVVVWAPYAGAVAKASPEAGALTLMQYNVLTENAHHAETAAYLRGTSADVICLQETSRGWLDDVSRGLPEHRLAASHPRADNYGIAMYHKPGGVQLRHAQVLYPIEDKGVPVGAVAAKFAFGGREANILTLHAHPPFSQNHDRMRAELLREVARWVRTRREPVILAGDFNASPWSTPFRRFLQHTGLVSSQRRFGPRPTWLPYWGVLGGLVIDHVLHSPQLATLAYRVGPDTGSDHRPVRVVLGWQSR